MICILLRRWPQNPPRSFARYPLLLPSPGRLCPVKCQWGRCFRIVEAPHTLTLNRLAESIVEIVKRIEREMGGLKQEKG